MTRHSAYNTGDKQALVVSHRKKVACHLTCTNRKMMLASGFDRHNEIWILKKDASSMLTKELSS